MAYAVSLRRFHLEGVRDTGRIIGEGAYAVVKELEFRGLKCVGKRIHNVLYENAMPAFKADMLQRFAAECELLGQLHHPHIVQFLGVRVEAGLELPELVMEYLPTTVRHCLDMHGILPAEISCSILLDVGLGLLYLHKLSPPVIHRDLSSNNVLLTTSMTAKISDLGVAKILDVNPIRAAQMTQTQTPGTPTFMPPEALASRPKYTCKVDIFSYGILMVHVLSGEWPIPDGSFVEDPRDPNNMIPVNEFERRHESIEKIGEDHPLLGLIEQCLSNVANRRPDTADLVCQLKAEQARVPLGLENRLELLQEVKLLRAELQKSSGENEALRRNTEALTSEVKKLKINVTGAAEWSKERQSLEARRANLARQVETLRAELARRKHSEVEVKNLREHVQRLTKQPAASPPQARHTQLSPELKPRTMLRWKRGANAPEEFIGAQAVMIGESVYVGGGTALLKVHRYGWSVDVWSTLPDCPVSWFGLTQFAGKLTTVGGENSSCSVTGKLYQFEDNSRRWRESLPPMPTARSYVTVIARRSNSPKPLAIAVCGGWGDGGVVCNNVEVFCNSTSQWYVAEQLPTPLYWMTSATVANFTFLLGGRDNSHSNARCCFSVSLDSLIDKAITNGASKLKHDSLWTSISDTPLTLSCAADMGGYVVAMGGVEASMHSPSAAIHLLTRDGSWRRVKEADLPVPCCQSTAVCLPSGKLLVAGGSNGVNEQCSLFITD